MIKLEALKNTHRPYKARKRVGRGLGSKTGKTCGRGEKGAGARAGYKRRYGKEGGNMPLFMKLPIRGFSNFNFRRTYDVVNLEQIERVFSDGEVVSLETLKAKGFISGPSRGVKILAKGDLTKDIKLHVAALSEAAKQKLSQSKTKIELVQTKSRSARD